MILSVVLQIEAGASADNIYIYGMGDNTEAKIWGQDGNDVLTVDGTFLGDNSVLSNTLDLSSILWSGGGDNDTANVVLASTGTSSVTLFDDLDGFNELDVECADFACYLLSRENFLANVHNMTDPLSTVERINIDRVRTDAGGTNETRLPNWEPTANIASAFVALNGGENKMYFDGEHYDRAGARFIATT
jgi:hypothetical protein